SHSLCQKYYNQIVLSNQFYEYLLDLFSSIQQGQLDTNMDIQTSYANLMQYLEEQEKEVKELNKKLQEAYEEDSRFFSQQKRINAVIKIAKAEHELLFDDI
ncbi:7213_t:CDS:2, partial [Scutellospora calospora]